MTKLQSMKQLKLNSKVFCIGFHKTGTTSIGKALEILGYKVIGCVHNKDRQILSNENRIYEIANGFLDKYNAFQDNPWPLLYKWLDKKYPSSKFILTIREKFDWINSVVNHFGYNDTPMREYIYGVGHPKGNEKIYIRRYEQHNAEVVQYFHNSNNLLILDINEREKWKNICHFLQKNIPNVEFPHLNKAKNIKSTCEMSKTEFDVWLNNIQNRRRRSLFLLEEVRKELEISRSRLENIFAEKDFE